MRRRLGFAMACGAPLVAASVALGAANGCAADDSAQGAGDDGGADTAVVFDAALSDTSTVDANAPCLADSGAWCPVAVPVAGVDLTAVWGSSPTDVWTVGYPEAILHWSGATWAPVGAPPMHVRLTGVAGRGPNDVWFGATAVLTYHFDGRMVDGGPQVVYVAPPVVNGGIDGDDTLGALWPSKDGAVWAAGGSTLYRSTAFDNDAGPTWERVGDGALATKYAAGFSLSPSTTYVVGDQGVVIEVVNGDAGAVVTAQRSQTVRALNGIWGAGSALFACGEGGTILRATRGASDALLVFAPDATGTTQSLNGVWGTSPEDVWVVGDHGTILHWDGKAWTSDPSVTTSSDLYAVWGSGAGDVWAVGRDVILHRTKGNP